ncbi:hypothetical protein [Peribacillus loiseleuriae]|uniref:hypothetical protein n=1 Tax=Peribacillus loiseleuriae TaxID=1679170 RepID=UPI003D0854D1
MNYNFYIKGSQQDPYLVEFVLNGGIVLSSCDCAAGRHSMICKHIIGVASDREVVLVENNYDELERLRGILADSDFQSLINKKTNKSDNDNKLKLIYTLKPKRRKTMDTANAITVLNSNGFAKGNGNVNFLDFYDQNLNYVGSVKTPKSVFNSDLPSLLGITVQTVRKKDKQIHDNSIGLYCFVPSSDLRELF